MSNTDVSKITKKDIRNAGLRWMVMGIHTFNYETQLAPTAVYTLAKALRKVYPDDEDYKTAMLNHYKFYNSMPYMSQIILGASLGIEESMPNENGREAVQNFKTGLMGPLAGIGDTVFWILLPTIFGGIAAYMAIEGNPFGVILWMTWQVCLTIFRMVSFFPFGYSMGMKVVTVFKDKLNILTEAASILGLFVVGALIPATVSVGVPYVIQIGEIASPINDLLDSVMPKLIPVLLTFFSYWLVGEKKVKITYVILGVIVSSFILNYFQILG